jgi:aspartyl-tRNA(Asn)/glutamyl-tRNA(Gln) amidotransferase subunit A
MAFGKQAYIPGAAGPYVPPSPANLAGICGMSVPCGFAETDGHRLPVGLQLLGKAFDEGRILQIAHAYEQSTDWHKARSPIAASMRDV